MNFDDVLYNVFDGIDKSLENMFGIISKETHEKVIKNMLEAYQDEISTINKYLSQLDVGVIENKNDLNKIFREIIYEKFPETDLDYIQHEIVNNFYKKITSSDEKPKVKQETEQPETQNQEPTSPESFYDSQFKQASEKEQYNFVENYVNAISKQAEGTDIAKQIGSPEQFYNSIKQSPEAEQRKFINEIYMQIVNAQNANKQYSQAAAKQKAAAKA